MLTFVNVKKHYQGKAGEVQALDGLSFAMEREESLVLIGPSGCGKSTALLLAAGLLEADEGSILIEGRQYTAPRLGTGLILQDYGLLPWKTVFENAALGLRIRKLPRAPREEQTREILEQVGLADFASNYPGELSGGMRQRLALARALALDVDLLLMDEPLSALDLELRETLQDLLLTLWRSRGYSQLIVTHSIDEAVYLGQRILVMGPRPGTLVAELLNPLAGSSGYRSSSEFFAKATQLRTLLLDTGDSDGVQ
ncbi:MAG: ATP-binding cassette domain-containing protein [Coriobacteriales bacterium]|jgi:NitT/TauT family transport system ATP-binding protein|nr:ATP-binding cassette domain-containing protein [Coriobacteriales bacterium]